MCRQKYQPFADPVTEAYWAKHQQLKVPFLLACVRAYTPVGVRMREGVLVRVRVRARVRMPRGISI